ncbi:tyrosine-type recombinase/integrase [Paenibacillus polymyxa]|uniref:tyrosine-type recombinase/integrase n=1 Tax=Paenibacillus polymyxa TaxID=1406 RepID=UPI0021E4D6DC|nr:tyrosine-type recombinase/integrase [Paenibacillus polymyxa]
MARLRSIKLAAGNRTNRRQLLTEFLAYKKLEDGVDQYTLNDYDRTVNLLFKRFPKAWESEQALRDAVMEHLAQDIAPPTFNNRLVYLRTFFKYCISEGELSTNPLATMKKRRTEERAVSIEVDVLNALLAAPNQNTFVGLRDYTLILLTLDTGIRPSEGTKLIPQDFNASLREIYVPAKVAKGRVARTLPMSEVTRKALRKLISVRAPEWGDNVPIFCSYEGRELNRHTWGDRIEIYRIKIGAHIRPYDLRHVFALEFLRNGANAFATQRALGHATLEMTRRYVALVNSDLKRSTRRPVRSIG